MSSNSLAGLRNLIETKVNTVNLSLEAGDTQGYYQGLRELQVMKLAAYHCGVYVLLDIHHHTAGPTKLISIEDQRTEVGDAV